MYNSVTTYFIRTTYGEQIFKYPIHTNFFTKINFTVQHFRNVFTKHNDFVLYCIGIFPIPTNTNNYLYGRICLVLNHIAVCEIYLDKQEYRGTYLLPYNMNLFCYIL